MTAKDNFQLELFSQTKDEYQKKSESNRKYVLFQFKKHERVLLLITAFIITGIISFSLGVKKGKTQLNSKATTALIKEEKIPVDAAIKAPIKEEVPGERVVLVKHELEQKEGYTIQLACYKTESYANREAQRLKEKGLTPFIQKKGDYIVLSVGNFPDRESAKSLMSDLKHRYKGCYVRRL